MDLDADILIIGAGIAGSALAMHLAENGAEDVCVIDPDYAGARSSSERNAGGVRATWWQRENIALCARTIGRFAAHAEQVGFRPHGYLWLYGERAWLGAVAALDAQNAYGCEIELLSPRHLAERYPWIARTPDLAGATFSPHDGLVNPDLVRSWYRERARRAGARFFDRLLVVAGARADDGTWTIDAHRLPDEPAAHQALAGEERAGEAHRTHARVVVNAAGPWAGHVARCLGYASAAFPCPREISVFASDAPLVGAGMIVDTSGCYVHHESGALALAGWSPPDHTPRVSFAHEGRAFFEREIWPRLARRIPALERAEYVRGWMGLYDLSPDRTAIAGAVTGHGGLYEMHSFSGRGVMQADALAELVAEEVLTGTAPELLAAFSATRFGRRELPEALHI